MSKYIDYQLLLAIIAIPIILVVLFPSPYYHVWYDAEPDYIANTLSIYINNHPVDYIHPGLTINYISSFFIHLVGSFDSMESLVKSLRMVLIYINLLIIYLAMVVLNKSEKHHVYLFLILLLLHPSSFYYFDLLNPNIILGSLGILVAIMGVKLQEKPIIFSFYFGVILAIGVATKYQFILMSVPLLISIIFGILKITEEKFQVSKFLTLSTSFIFTSLILFFPILPMMPFYLTLWTGNVIGVNFGFNDLEIWHIIFYLFILIFLFSIFIVVLKRLFWNKKEYRYIDIYTQSSFLILIFLLLTMIISVLGDASYLSLTFSQRNFLPLFGFIGLFLTSKYSFFNLFRTRRYIIYLLLLAISIKAYSNFTNHQNSSPINLNFDLAVSKLLEEENDLIFFPSSIFTSKDYFLIWADYRYGDRIQSYTEHPDMMPFKLDKKFDKLHILNFRSFYLSENIEGRFSFKYFNYFLNNPLTPIIHKGILKNHLDASTKKDICKKPYNNFSEGDNFTVIIPVDLKFHSNKFDIRSVSTYRNKDGNTVSIEAANSSAKALTKNLVSLWTNQCNYEVDYSIDNFTDIEAIFLKIKT